MLVLLTHMNFINTSTLLRSEPAWAPVWGGMCSLAQMFREHHDEKEL
jgi:hypothetical protein